MLLRKQVLVTVWTVVWVITVDGAVLGKNKKEVLREFSNIVVDKTPNAMKVQEYDVKFLDNFEHKSAHESGSKDATVVKQPSLDFNDPRAVQESGLDFNELTFEDKDEYSSGGAFSEEEFANDVKIIRRRGKRQAEMIPVEGADDIQNIWQGMMQTMVEGGKTILKKFADGLGKDPEAIPDYNK